MFKQTVLDNELQGLFHMGFDSSSAIDNLGANGKFCFKFVYVTAKLVIQFILTVECYHVKQDA